MTTDLASILSDLRTDHRNVTIMLNLLDREIAETGNLNEPDFELMRDIMLYMTVYSDAVHHPKEDLVYAALAAAGAEFAAGLENVESDHRDIGVLGRTLRHEIDAVLTGTAVARERVIEDTLDYIRLLRLHMSWEEEDLFLRADRLAEDAASGLDLTYFDTPDPVFGLRTHLGFSNLLAHIHRAADSGTTG